MRSSAVLSGLADLVVVGRRAFAMAGRLRRARRPGLGRVRGDALVLRLDAARDRLGRALGPLPDERAGILARLCGAIRSLVAHAACPAMRTA
jgi:hypothetical protein